MKKLILSIVFLLALLVFIGPGYARSDADRMIGSDIETSSALLSSATDPRAANIKIYGMTIIATANNAEAAIIDSAVDSSSAAVATVGEVKVEIGTAAQYDSETIMFPDGLSVEKGMYLYLSNAKAIVYYH